MTKIITGPELRAEIFSIARRSLSTSHPPIASQREHEPSTVEIDALVVAERKILDAVRGAFAILRAHSARPPDDPDDFVKPSVIVGQFQIPRPTLYSLCLAHPTGSPHGFAKWDHKKNRYTVSVSLFAEHLRERLGRLPDADGNVRW